MSQAASARAAAPAPQDDPLRTCRFAADYLGISTRHLYRLIADGSLPALRISGGRTVRIRQSALDGLLVPVANADTGPAA